MLSLPLKRFAIVRIGVHALALLSGVVALVGLAQTTVEKGSEETSRRTAMGYLGVRLHPRYLTKTNSDSDTPGISRHAG